MRATSALGIQDLETVPISSAPSTCVSAPRGTTTMSAPSRAGARCTRSWAPCTTSAVDSANAAMAKAQSPKSQLLSLSPAMLRKARPVRLRILKARRPLAGELRGDRLAPGPRLFEKEKTGVERKGESARREQGRQHGGAAHGAALRADA